MMNRTKEAKELWATSIKLEETIKKSACVFRRQTRSQKKREREEILLEEKGETAFREEEDVANNGKEKGRRKSESTDSPKIERMESERRRETESGPEKNVLPSYSSLFPSIPFQPFLLSKPSSFPPTSFSKLSQASLPFIYTPTVQGVKARLVYKQSKSVEFHTWKDFFLTCRVSQTNAQTYSITMQDASLSVLDWSTIKDELFHHLKKGGEKKSFSSLCFSSLTRFPPKFEFFSPSQKKKTSSK